MKAKIQQRPARQELERRHILECHEGHIDPSLADKYRMLEKAILVDQLNSKISHRPGPLELIEKNILHANEPIERIVKEGLVPFKVSNEDPLLSFEDDSSSEGDLFQHQLPQQVQSEVNFNKDANMAPKPKEICSNSQEKQRFESLPTSSTGLINISLVPTSNMLTSTASAPISVATFQIHSSGEKSEVSTINIPPAPPCPPKLITYHVKPVLQTQLKLNTQTYLPVQITEAPLTNLNLIPALVPTCQPQSAVNQHVSSFIQNNKNFSAPGKEKNRKKCKNIKAVSKARAIKFHEYKGPPNKSNSSSSLSSSASLAASKKLGETNYELIMQQQCLLEYLEGIYKNPHAQALAIKSENEFQKDITKPIKIERISESSQEKLKTFNKPHVTIFPSKPSAQSSPSSVVDTKDSVVTDVAKLSKMKVSELKAYLKRVNLPVSGPKPLLIERLKPYLPLKPLEDCYEDTSSNMMSEGNDIYNASLPSVSSTESDMDNNMDAQSYQCHSQASSIKDEDIVAEQQRKIEELQRKLQQSQQELEQMKQHKVVDVPSHQQNIIFDPIEYKMANQISTIFVVDVASPVNTGEECTKKDLSSPTKIKTEILLNAASPTSAQHVTRKLSIDHSMLNGNKDSSVPFSLCHQINKEAASISTPQTNTVVPMSQDITDVLEILLKNGEWPEMPEDVKSLDTSNFIQNSNDNSLSFSNENMLTAKHFIGDVLSAQNTFMSPMNEDPISPAINEESIDKILGNRHISVSGTFDVKSIYVIADTVTPTTNNHLLDRRFSNTFSQENNIEFPMDIEDDSLANTDFNRDVFESQEFLSKPHNMHYEDHFNPLKIENCDNKYNGYQKSVSNSQDEGIIKSANIKSQKNGLIGNFDHNMLFAPIGQHETTNTPKRDDNYTLKNNNINNNYEFFTIPQDGKFVKDDSKSMSSNFDMFGTGIIDTAMDFESIIPYNDLQSHDSLFQISGFDNALSRGNFSDGLFNDDTGMTCEADNLNLLCN